MKYAILIKVSTALLVALAAAACNTGPPPPNLSCQTLLPHAQRITHGWLFHAIRPNDPSGYDTNLLQVTDIEQVHKSENDLTCRGKGLFLHVGEPLLDENGKRTTVKVEENSVTFYWRKQDDGSTTINWTDPDRYPD